MLEYESLFYFQSIHLTEELFFSSKSHAVTTVKS